jgi:hypothetical protein
MPNYIKKWLADQLKAEGYDGLCSPDCSCLLPDLAPCGDLSQPCLPGHRVDIAAKEECGCDCQGVGHWHIVAGKKDPMIPASLAAEIIGRAECSLFLRDYFAAQALHAAVEDYTLACRSGGAHGKPVLPKFCDKHNGHAFAVAQTAYALADAMLEAREPNNPKAKS